MYEIIFCAIWQEAEIYFNVWLKKYLIQIFGRKKSTEVTNNVSEPEASLCIIQDCDERRVSGGLSIKSHYDETLIINSS